MIDHASTARATPPPLPWERPNHRADPTRTGRCLGYARAPEHDPTGLEDQIQALRAAGCAPDAVFQDRAMTVRDDRPGLEACLEALESGDTLLAAGLDRIARSLPDLVEKVAELTTRRVRICTLGEPSITIEPQTPAAEVFEWLTDVPHRLRAERARVGQADARAKGRRSGGRKPITADDPRVQMAQTLREGKRSIREICRALKASRSSVYRWLEIAQAAGSDPQEKS